MLKKLMSILGYEKIEKKEVVVDTEYRYKGEAYNDYYTPYSIEVELVYVYEGVQSGKVLNISRWDKENFEKRHTIV